MVIPPKPPAMPCRRFLIRACQTPHLGPRLENLAQEPCPSFQQLWGLIMRLWTAVILLMLSTSHSVGQASLVDKIVIVEKGVYRAEIIKKIEIPTATGAINTVADIRLLESTTYIPARKGVRFGVRYTIVGASKGSSVDLRLTTRFPVAGLRNPITGRHYFNSEHPAARMIGNTGYREYAFEHDWEVVPGKWTFEFWYRNRKVGEQSFCIYRSPRRRKAVRARRAVL